MPLPRDLGTSPAPGPRPHLLGWLCKSCWWDPGPWLCHSASRLCQSPSSYRLHSLALFLSAPRGGAEGGLSTSNPDGKGSQHLGCHSSCTAHTPDEATGSRFSTPTGDYQLSDWKTGFLSASSKIPPYPNYSPGSLSESEGFLREEEIPSA